MLFQSEMSGASSRETVALYRACFAEGPFPDAFSIALFESVMARRDEIDAIIERSSEHWRIDRMSRVDRNILRIGVQEITAGEEIPVRVAINEAVELAKRFGTHESAAFVNGILDRVARDERRL
jgi:N utilization substance protein B